MSRENSKMGKSLSCRLREALIIRKEKRVLLANLAGSLQSEDAYTQINCQGFGRVRCFKKYLLHLRSFSEKTIKPLLRGHPAVDVLRSQVFQLAGCNWNCWYCFVDKEQRAGSAASGKYFTAEEMLELYLKENDRPDIIDLSGGQPDLVPEWGLWTMQALERQHLKGEVFLWTDDNMSNYSFWKFLDPKQIRYMASFPKYSRVGCFKGYDENSFSFNTHMNPKLFQHQFDIFKAYLREGFDMYAYATFTSIPHKNLDGKIALFMDRLQNIHPNLPLRTIPIRIKAFSVPQHVMLIKHEEAIKFQFHVYDAWKNELLKRFGENALNLPYEMVTLR